MSDGVNLPGDDSFCHLDGEGEGESGELEVSKFDVSEDGIGVMFGFAHYE